MILLILQLVNLGTVLGNHEARNGLLLDLIVVCWTRELVIGHFDVAHVGTHHGQGLLVLQHSQRLEIVLMRTRIVLKRLLLLNLNRVRCPRNTVSV